MIHGTELKGFDSILEASQHQVEALVNGHANIDVWSLGLLERLHLQQDSSIGGLLMKATGALHESCM
jgi:hypothetical protein